MNLEQFQEEYKQFKYREQVKVNCSRPGCIREEILNKDSAIRNIKLNGTFVCRSCHFTVEGKARIGKANKYARSEYTKNKISKSKKNFYQTENGINLKKKLSEKAAREHSAKLHENSRRRGVYPSQKNKRLMPFNSSYELKGILLAEDRIDVISYECQVYFEINERHRCLDLILNLDNDRHIAVEIKPYNRLNEELVQLQIDDSRRFAESKKYGFEVWTEKELGFQSPFEATKWADDYMSKITDRDFIEDRKQMNREKALKFHLL